MKIKFCGLKNVDDFVNAAQLDVDFVGFVNYKKSIRYVSKKVIQDIIEQGRTLLHKKNIKVPKIVILAVDQDVREINDFYKSVKFDIVQMYHEENLERLEINYWKVRNISSKNDVLGLKVLGSDIKNNSGCVGVVLDSAYTIGGSGKSFDWSWLQDNPLHSNYLVAGGINIDNLGTLLGYRPYGIDISSGIESLKGEKDLKLMKMLVHKARVNNETVQFRTDITG